MVYRNYGRDSVSGVGGWVMITDITEVFPAKNNPYVIKSNGAYIPNIALMREDVASGDLKIVNPRDTISSWRADKILVSCWGAQYQYFEKRDGNYTMIWSNRE